jgi:hypothetical protein
MVGRKLKRPPAVSAQEAGRTPVWVLALGKKEAGEVQAHEAMLPESR